MKPIGAEELLAVWERGVSFAPHQRALAILALASSTPADELSLLPIAERDARLLRFREQTFGRAIEGLVECPACREMCELSFRTSDVSSPDAAPSEWSFQFGGRDVRFRLPNTADVGAALQEEDARATLLRQCLLDDVEESDALFDALEEEMERVDPSSTRIDVTCPFCSHRWLCALDAGAFLWSEIETWGRRTLTDVHVLASAYGWRESDILSMSAWRRRRYLELLGV